MRTARGRERAQAVIEYAKSREREAELQNDRMGRLHWQAIQLIVFQAFYGAEPAGWGFRLYPRTQPLVEPRRLTRGQREMKARPLRKVLRRVDVVMGGVGGAPSEAGYVEVLECGHRQPTRMDYFGETTANRRRCEQCRVSAAPVKVIAMPRASA